MRTSLEMLDSAADKAREQMLIEGVWQVAKDGECVTEVVAKSQAFDQAYQSVRSALVASINKND